MNFIILISFFTLCSLTFAYQVNEREPLPPKLPLQPGDLLRSLDELTSDADIIYSPLRAGPPKTAERRAYNDENVEHSSEFDYDKAYEDFVSKYFAQGEEDLASENEDERSIHSDSGSVTPYEATNETDDLDESASKTKKKSSKSKKCERVEIDDQDCLVCEDSKTNEKSKSCSYSSDSKPKSYKFSRERSQQSSKDDDDDGSNESAEAGRSIKREASPKNEKIQSNRRTSIKEFIPSAITDKGLSLRCTRKKEDGMICYYCGTKSKHSRECMVDKNNPTNRRLDESSKKDSTTKKVFKRMVTYSFKNDAKPEVKENTYAAFKGY